MQQSDDLKEGIMRFGGVALSHNPKELSVKYAKRLSSDMLVSGGYSKEKVVRLPERISGRGELYGSGCLNDYGRLMTFYREDKASIVSVPYLGAFRAVITSLTLAAEPKEDYIAVNFEFTAAPGKAKKLPDLQPYYETRRDGEDMWDIAYYYGLDINELVGLNPHIRKIRDLDRFERVRLC